VLMISMLFWVVLIPGVVLFTGIPVIAWGTCKLIRGIMLLLSWPVRALIDR
jgi:hypothetical protein